MSQTPEALLSETDPAALNELFEKDPLMLTREEEKIIIAKLREARNRWASEDRAAKTQNRRAKTSAGIKDPSKATKKAAQAEALANDLGIDLESLVGDL